MSLNINKPPISINRDTISSGLLQKLATQRDGSASNLLSEDELLSSRRSFIADNHDYGDIWVFGYGSLIWNPTFEYTDRQHAHLFGYHRRFCLWTTITRGTPEKPGLVLGLDRGGSSKGIIYRVPAAIAVRECDILWKREMLNGAYRPSWLQINCSDGQKIKALSFVIRQDHPSFAEPLPDETISKIIARASGIIGPCSDYLFHTQAALKAEGIHDARITKLARLVERINTK